MKLENMIPVWTKPALWGAAVGAVVWWIALSSGFGWVSAGAAKQATAQQVREAVVAYAVPACVARFEGQKNPVAAWETLKKTDEWSRGDVIKKGGWVAEPGQKVDSNTADAIASNCVTQVLALKVLNGVKLSVAK